MPSLVSQQHIADALSISRTSVSRALAHHPAVNPETRARVMAMAAQLGYRVAESKWKRARPAAPAGGMIGILVAASRDPKSWVTETSQYMLAGVTERLRREGLGLDLHYLDPQLPLPPVEEFAARFNAERSDWHGVLLVYPLPEDWVRRLARRMPCVSIVEDYFDAGVDCVDTDQAGAMFSLVRHLADLGHRRFGFLTWRYRSPTPWAQRRLGGFVEALMRLDLPFDPNDVLNGRESGSIPIDRLGDVVASKISSGVTAWVCAADHQAYALISDLQRLGLRVPDHVSVTGFDGVEPPPGFPRLTSVRIPYRDMGVSAVTRLINRAQSPASPRRHIMLGGTPVWGETTAASPRNAG
jgi:LacI family transcriptional regulator